MLRFSAKTRGIKSLGAAKRGFSKKGGLERMGKIKGNTPKSNIAQNEQVRSLAKKYGLSKPAQKRLHRRISNQGLSFKEIEEIIKHGDF
ncbi:MAG: hypothetical protein AAF600_20560 [Bacteroidota bacterium]